MTPSRLATLSTAAVAAAAIAGCGSSSSADEAHVRTTAKTVKQQADASLSPQGRTLLHNARTVASHVADTAKGYANQTIPQSLAMRQFTAEVAEAKAIGRRAAALPATSSARKQIAQLSASAAQIAGALQSKAAANTAVTPSAVRAQLDTLQSAAQQAYEQLRGQLPATSRDELQTLVDQLSGK